MPGRFFCNAALRGPFAVAHLLLFQTTREWILPHSSGFPRASGPILRGGPENRRKELKICRKQHPLPIRLRSKSEEER